MRNHVSTACTRHCKASCDSFGQSCCCHAAIASPRRKRFRNTTSRLRSIDARIGREQTYSCPLFEANALDDHIEGSAPCPTYEFSEVTIGIGVTLSSETTAHAHSNERCFAGCDVGNSTGLCSQEGEMCTPGPDGYTCGKGNSLRDPCFRRTCDSYWTHPERLLSSYPCSAAEHFSIKNMGRRLDPFRHLVMSLDARGFSAEAHSLFHPLLVPSAFAALCRVENGLFSC